MYILDKSSLFFEYKIFYTMMMFRANMYLINHLNFDSIYFYLIHMLYKQSYFHKFSLFPCLKDFNQFKIQQYVLIYNAIIGILN